MAYKPTLFDRHGPDAGHILEAWGWGLLIFGLTSGTFLSEIGFRRWVLPVGAGLGALGGGAGWFIGTLIGDGWEAVAVDGSSTPYERQFSYEQSLVMQGRVVEALRLYVTNRLVDLYLGSLNDPGRAMVELRRLIDRRPGSAAAEHARRSLADLKSRGTAGA